MDKSTSPTKSSQFTDLLLSKIYIYICPKENPPLVQNQLNKKSNNFDEKEEKTERKGKERKYEDS